MAHNLDLRVLNAEIKSLRGVLADLERSTKKGDAKRIGLARDLVVEGAQRVTSMLPSQELYVPDFDANKIRNGEYDPVKLNFKLDFLNFSIANYVRVAEQSNPSVNEGN